MALAVLSVPEKLKTIAPSAKFTLITQNVDGLSARAFQEVCPSGSPPLFEMHGRLFETLCTVCKDRVANFDSPICPALAGTEELVEKHEEPVIPLEDLPRCQKPGCGGLLRPGVVWFEEIPHYLDEINVIVDEADLALVVGTSSVVRPHKFYVALVTCSYVPQVYPAAGYAYEVAEHGGKVAVFNIQHSEGDEDADFLFLGPCEEMLPRVLFGTELFQDAAN